MVIYPQRSLPCKPIRPFFRHVVPYLPASLPLILTIAMTILIYSPHCKKYDIVVQIQISGMVVNAGYLQAFINDSHQAIMFTFREAIYEEP